MVGVRLNEQGNLWCLSWVEARWVDLFLCPQNPISLYRGLKWVKSHIPSRWSQHHITISSLCSWGSFWVQGGQVEHTFQGQGRRRGASDCWHPAHRSTGGNFLLVTSCNSPSFVTGSYDLTQHSLPECALSSQQGVSLGWRWLFLAAMGLHWRQMPQQPFRDMEEKIQFKIMIPKISDNLFCQKAHDPKPLTWLSPLSQRTGHSRHHLCPPVIYQRWYLSRLIRHKHTIFYLGNDMGASFWDSDNVQGHSIFEDRFSH